MNDLRLALRRLARTPLFTIVAILTLALGIGANSAIFSVINAVLLRALPYPDEGRLVWVYGHSREGDQESLDPPEFLALRRDVKSFSGLAAAREWPFNVRTGGDPVRVDGAIVSSDFFSVLGVAPEMGRVPDALNGDLLNPGQVVVSDGYWRTELGARRDVIGTTINISGEPVVITGVMPTGFDVPEGVRIWRPSPYPMPPHPLHPADDPSNFQGGHYFDSFARIRPGITNEAALADASAEARRVTEKADTADQFTGAEFVTLHEDRVGDSRTALLVLLGASSVLLLIACVNLANLQLARAAARSRDRIVRAALGASRWRLAKEQLMESSLLTVAGGGAGLLVAVWGVTSLRTFAPASLQSLIDPNPDLRVLGFTMVVAALTGAGFGLGPALSSSRTDLASGVREGGRGTSDTRARRRVRDLLATAEIALACLLAIGAGLLVKTFAELQRVPEGFDPRGTLTASLNLPAVKYATPEQRAAFVRQATDRIAALPQVTDVGVISRLPLNPGSSRSSMDVFGKTSHPTDPSPDYLTASPGYFKSLDIPVSAGRGFDSRDVIGSPPVAIVNAALANFFFKGQNPIGQRIRIRDTLWREVVGVTRDVRQHLLERAPIPAVYIPYAQDPWGNANLVVRTTADPASLTHTIEREIHALDADQPLAAIRTMDEVVDRSLAARRFTLTLIGLFTTIALALAAIGVYGVIAYNISQRTREMGVRIALGALPRDVVALVVRDGLKLAAIGVAAGLVVAIALAPVLRSMLYAVTPRDPATFVAVGVMVTAVALIASWLPARRASRVDPVDALRSD